MSTTNFKFNPFTNNLDLVGAGGSPGGVIETINTIPPDASDNFTIAEGTGVTITPGTNEITISVNPGTAVVATLTGNSGGAISPVSGNINTEGTGSITIAGAGNTLTTELTGLTNHAVLVGAGTATITKVGPTATSGQVLQSQGSTTDPAFSTATYPADVTANEILYASASHVVGQITAVDNGVLITSSAGVPSLLANGTTGQILTATTGSPPSWENAPSGGITTLDADSGSATGSTVTISGGTTGLTTTASSATVDLTGTLNGAHGGTGVDNSGLTINLGSATSGYVLTSDSSGNGTWQAAGSGGISTVDGDSGSVTGSTITLTSGYSSQNCGSTVKFAGSSTTMTMDFTDANASTCLGESSGVTPNFNFIANTVVGYDSLNHAANSSATCVVVGAAAMRASTGCAHTVSIGNGTLNAATSSQFNTCVGYEAAVNITSGGENTIIGALSGSGYTSSEANNIILGQNIAGTTAESNAIRIGNSSNSTCFITGIEGVSTSNPNIVLVNTSTNQLGSTSTLSGALGGTGHDNSGLTINLGSATSGYVLTSDSSGNATWQAGGGGGSLTIDVDGSGSVSGSTIDLYANSGSANAGSTVAFIAASGTEIDLQTSDANGNTIIGQYSGTAGTTATANTGLGAGCLVAMANGSLNNVAVGVNALEALDVGTDNTGIGRASLNELSGSSGSYNTALGSSSGIRLLSGGSNTLIGYNAGFSYLSSESKNICISSNGIASESHAIHIGDDSFISATKCFIGGIEGVSTSNPNIVLVNTSTNQLGSTSTLSGALGGTGVDNSGLTINLGSATSGYVLTSDSSGNATWQAGGGGGSLTINVDASGSVSGSTVDLYANSGSANAGGSVAFIAASGTEIDLQLTDGSFNTQLGNGTSGTGSYNTSIGASTFGGSSGTNNVAIGYSAANGAIFTNSVIIGSNSANSEEGNSFANSTFVGYSAGWDIQGSSSNCTLIGYYAGSNYVNDESQNICISSNGVRNESNVIHIGDDSLIAATQCFIGGISGATVTGSAVLCSSSGQLGTISSSQRYKKNIHDMDEASEVIMGLRPVTFAYKSDPNEALNYGLIAEEVEEICPNLVVYDKEGKPDSVSYHMLPAMLLNELQKQAKIIADLTERLEALEG